MRKIEIEASEEELKVLEMALQEATARFQEEYIRRNWLYENGTYPKKYADKAKKEFTLLRSIQDKIVQEIDFGDENAAMA